MLFSLSVPSAFAGEEIRLTTGEFPPFISESLKHYGPAPHIVTKAFASEGVSVRFRVFPWKRAYITAKRGEEYVGSGFWLEAERRKKDFWYSDPVYESRWAFFYLKSFRFDWNTLEDLRGIRVGVTREFTYTKELYDAIDAGTISADWVSHEYLNIRKLLKGRIDIAIFNTEVGYYLLRKEAPQNFDLLIHHPKPLVETNGHLIFTKKREDNRRLIKLFNKGLKKLKKSGEYDRIFEASRRGEYIIKD
ncbi:substrate-binding periplasmic protein [Desulfonema ishimotonii]|nr:transporter substrate-binding domain-containing protein [Desulfonema ishimotonii]